MESQNPQTVLKTLKTIHWSLVAGLSLFAAVVIFQLGGNDESKFVDDEIIMIFIPGIMAIFLIPAAQFLFKRQLSALREKKTLSEKLIGYQSAHIIKVGMLEAVGLTALVISLVTFTTINIYVFVIVLIFMAGSAPTAFRLGDKLGLSREEVETLEG